MKSFLSFAAALILSAMVAQDASACWTFQNAFNPTFKNDPSADLNDYGRIHHDADDANCAQAAMYSLTDKLNQHLDANSTTFQQWLDGFHVALIYGSAMRIGAQGWASQDLDNQLYELSTRFQHNTTEPSGSCGTNEWNGCMDDHTGTASGYAWMAAYMKRRPNRFTQAQVDVKIALAVDHLRKALKPINPYVSTELKNGICLRKTPAISPTNSYPAPLCNGTLAELSTGAAQTFTLNGQKMMLHYGFGLMTSVASAKMGLEQAGSLFQFSADEILVAKKLLEEVNRHFDAGTREFSSTCVMKNRPNGVWDGTYVQNVECGWGYRPDMYALKAFYDTRLGGTPAGSYTSNNFRSDFYTLEDSFTTVNLVNRDTKFFSYGRFETYGIQAYAWYVSNPPRTWMPYDVYNPKGWIDGISSTGVATGWACDQDMPTGRTFVDFYTYDGTTFTFLVKATANQYSGTAYQSQCGNGTAHRYTMQLPSWSKGKLVRAWALDYTWNGTTELGCSQSGSCSW
jgi:hypothetical protein